jgi:hypothetical protein
MVMFRGAGSVRGGSARTFQRRELRHGTAAEIYSRTPTSRNASSATPAEVKVERLAAGPRIWKALLCCGHGPID